MRKLAPLMIVIALALAGVASANLLLNPGFEVNGTQTWTSAYWAWDDPSGNTHGSYWGSIGNQSWHPHTGTNSAYMYKWSVGDQVDSGLWQETTNSAGAGSVWTASGWFYSDANYSNAYRDIRIEFFDGSYGALGTVSNSFAMPGPTYTMVSVVATAPVNTAWVRLGVEVKHTGMERSEGTFFVDDVSLAIPEPTVAALFGFAGLIFLAARRKMRK